MNIGKKILSAFVEVSEETKPPAPTEAAPEVSPPVIYQHHADTVKFKQYFIQLFEEANIPGPDYYEFSKMIEAMKVIPDEKARYAAAFAGLSAQGLDKTKLLSTASQYLQLLDKDASDFSNTIDVVLHERVLSRKTELEEKSNRIDQLSREIAELQNRIVLLQNEIKENEEKIESNSKGYQKELSDRKNKILSDIEKIKQHIS